MHFEIAVKHRFPGFELDLEIAGGAGVTALFGPSGSGKTTAIRAVAGLLRPNAGFVKLDDEVLFDAGTGVNVPAHLRRTGYVFQDGRLFPHLSVLDNLRFGRVAGRAELMSEPDLIELFGLGALLDRYPSSLSGGETQRVALGRALLSGPRMLLMDEPLAALDGPRKEEILPYLSHLKAEAQIPILYVTHAVEELARLADQVALLKDGRVIQQGPVFDVLASPAAMPLLGVHEAGSVLRATVQEQLPDGLTRLGTQGGVIELPGLDAGVGEQVRVRILARDVILAKTRPDGLSARNILPTEIESIEMGRGPGAAVVLTIGTERLLARITARSLQELELAPGQQVFAILKASAVSRGAIGK